MSSKIFAFLFRSLQYKWMPRAGPCSWVSIGPVRQLLAMLPCSMAWVYVHERGPAGTCGGLRAEWIAIGARGLLTRYLAVHCWGVGDELALVVQGGIAVAAGGLEVSHGCDHPETPGVPFIYLQLDGFLQGGGEGGQTTSLDCPFSANPASCSGIPSLTPSCSSPSTLPPMRESPLCHLFP